MSKHTEILLSDNHYVQIDSSCINCDMCVPECPSDSISMQGEHYQINKETCIRCEHYYPSPTCIEVCPIGSVQIFTVSRVTLI